MCIILPPCGSSFEPFTCQTINKTSNTATRWPLTTFHSDLRKWTRGAITGLSLCLVTACGTPEVTRLDTISDPHEAANRGMHEFNLTLDRALLRPVSLGYTTVLPDGVENSINNVAENLNVPSATINQVLQGDLEGAARNVLRFSINSTLGLAGIADVATGLGLESQGADFGQTMAVWGLPPGDYLVLPLFGPATQRDAIGLLVDIAINPLSGALYPNPALPNPYDYIATGARFGGLFSDRGRFAETIDSVLYDSADSYAASRDIYLQNRAFELEQAGVAAAAEADPYSDIFGDDPYADIFGDEPYDDLGEN